jgi:hypothetical protein
MTSRQPSLGGDNCDGPATPNRQAGRKRRWEDVSLKPKEMAQFSDTSAVITGKCNAKRKDGKLYHALVSGGYVKRPDGWKLAFHQQTALQHLPP